MRRNILKAANTAKKEVSAFLKDESGASVLEVVLLLVVAVTLVLIFKEQITDLVNNIFKKVSTNANKV
jgi:Flp pilus assembly pilin Flp